MEIDDIYATSTSLSGFGPGSQKVNSVTRSPRKGVDVGRRWLITEQRSS